MSDKNVKNTNEFSYKDEELNFFESFLAKKFSYSLSSFDRLLRVKQKIRTESLKLSLSKFGELPLTNRNHAKFQNESLGITFSYQRYDLRIKSKDFFSTIYDLPYNKNSVNIFVNSGMTSISAVLLALNSLGKFNIYHREDIYFETIKLLGFLNIKTSTIGELLRGKQVLFLDSISKTMNFLKEIRKYQPDIVILDTTCLAKYNYKEILSFLNNEQILCVFVRSHTKLDMLATEYSKLGSISFFFPDRLEREKKEFYVQFLLNTYELLAKLGGLASPEAIPPFWGKKFKAINEKRIDNIRRNTETLANILLNNTLGLDIILPEHKLFLLVDTGENTSSKMLFQAFWSELNTDKKIKEFVKLACSFGFDFIALDEYYDKPFDRDVIRISCSDYPDDLLRVIGYKMVNILDTFKLKN